MLFIAKLNLMVLIYISVRAIELTKRKIGIKILRRGDNIYCNAFTRAFGAFLYSLSSMLFLIT